MKNFCSSKYTIKRVKRLKLGENICNAYLCPEHVFLKPPQISKKNTDNPVENWVTDFKGHFTEG